MQLYIRHMTRYRYERPVKYSVQSLHLTPRRDRCQRSLSWTITAPGRRLEQIDAHGNIAHLLTIEQPHREIQIVVRGVVETVDTETRQDDGPLSPLAYLSPTTLTTPNEEIKIFARKTLEHVREPRERAQALADAVYHAVRYTTSSSDVQSPAATAFKNGEGVCQDHAHVFIAAARAVGMPARYVSGYLYTGDSSDAASHAWVDAWLGPDVGLAEHRRHASPARTAKLLPSRGGPRLPRRGAGARRAPRRRRRAHGSQRAGGRLGAAAVR